MHFGSFFSTNRQGEIVAMTTLRIEGKGFDTALRNFQLKVEEAAKPEEVSIEAACTSEFMTAHTDAPTLEAFIESTGFKPDSGEFAAIPYTVFDEHVKQHSRFGSWEEMQQEAARLYIAAKLAWIR